MSSFEKYDAGLAGTSASFKHEKGFLSMCFHRTATLIDAFNALNSKLTVTAPTYRNRAAL
jgi:hypothetical protein